MTTQDSAATASVLTAKERAHLLEIAAHRLQAAEFLDALHKQTCFEQGDHPDEIDTAFSLGADAIRAALTAPQAPTAAVTDQPDLTALMETVPVFEGENLHDDEGTWLGDGHEMLRKDQVMQVLAGTWTPYVPVSDDDELDADDSCTP